MSQPLDVIILGAGSAGLAALREVHPLGKSPVIEDGQRVVAESGAIVEYLAVRHGNGRLLPEPGSDD